MLPLFLLPALLGSAPAPGLPVVRPLDGPITDGLTRSQGASPEGTYAALVRAQIDGCPDLRPLFSKDLWSRLPKDGLKPATEEKRKALAALRLLEVVQHQDLAGVIVQMSPGQVRLQFLRQEEGAWRLLGHDTFQDPLQARAKATDSLLKLAKSPEPPQAKIPSPETHLAGFTRYLAEAGKAPQAFLLQALASHPLVAYGEIHNRRASWDLLTRLVQAPGFTESTGTLYLELPRSGQALMDRFLASPTLDLEPVREVLRGLFHDGWPCQDEVAFLEAVWRVNQALPASRRLRVVLVDQAWDWSQVRTKADLALLETDRDALMAEAILADRKASQDPRHALFQVGLLHLPCGLQGRDGKVFPSAGQRLRTALGRGFYTVVQHGPVMGNRGKVEGRVRRGLFDEAFAKQGNHPVAFPLDPGPFGREPFDLAPDLRGLQGTFGQAFDAYLFLGPLEQDRHSEVAPGFYTEAFAKEADRRARLMFGAGIQEVEDLKGSDGKAMEEGRRRWMGQPALWSTQLGPMDRWRK